MQRRQNSKQHMDRLASDKVQLHPMLLLGLIFNKALLPSGKCKDEEVVGTND